ncbi:MAG: chorismate synthase [Planctomycetes bacterium]|nr:chorismate synthase [Planctomycetota bacterium]
MLRYTSAGESHGDSLIAIIEGLPYKTPINTDFINKRLNQRNMMFGRSARMKIENDKVEILSGVRNNHSIGSPITLQIKNKVNNMNELNPQIVPRPGHADLPAMKKYKNLDARDFSEFASARLTAIRTSAGALAESILNILGITALSSAVQIGERTCNHQIENHDGNDLNCCKLCHEQFKSSISRVMEEGDTLGGAFIVCFKNVPAGIGTITPWEERLNAKLFRVLSSIQTVRAVELGSGINQSGLKGSQAHGSYESSERGTIKTGDISGGIEGGITNGSDIILKAYCKPIATLRKGYKSVDVTTKQESQGVYERSDTCTVSSCSLIAQSLLSFEILASILNQLYMDNFDDFKGNFERFRWERQQI